MPLTETNHWNRMYKALATGLSSLLAGPASSGSWPAGAESETTEVLEQLETEFQEQQLRKSEEALRQAQAYEQGNGVEQDDAAAVRFYKGAAERGDSEAQLRLGILYRQRKGVQEEFRNKRSRFSFGKTAFDFLFSSKMDQEAFRWLNAAAEQGVAEAQYYLAQFHEQGIGTNKNQDLADALYAQAKQAGFDSTLAIDLLRMEYDGIPPVVREPEVEILQTWLLLKLQKLKSSAPHLIRRKLSVATTPSRLALSVPCAPFRSMVSIRSLQRTATMQPTHCLMN